MRGKVVSAAALSIAAAAAASGAVPKKNAKPVEPAAIARTLDCGAHRFETTIQLNGPDGKPQDKTVRMCGTRGETNADWIVTLKDAVKKTVASPRMPQSAKDQIIAAVNAEISRLSLAGLNLPQGGDIAKLPRSSATNIPQAPLARDYSALPPLPTATAVAPPHLLGADGSIAQAAHLSLRCAPVGDEDRPEKCATIDKDTVLLVRADAPYPQGVALRFLRHGDSRADVNLAAMATGDTRKLRLPPAVCSGVVRSTIAIEALPAGGPGAVAGRVGEYDLRC
ncbi:MAG TPA: hypothetical protein VGU01_06475 [Sphingomicrobium sp.]|nr:hypothetical protein [Sphingomicrobium sp.]